MWGSQTSPRNSQAIIAQRILRRYDRKGGKEKGAQGGERRRGWCNFKRKAMLKKSKVRDVSGGEGRKRRGFRGGSRNRKQEALGNEEIFSVF